MGMSPQVWGSDLMEKCILTSVIVYWVLKRLADCPEPKPVHSRWASCNNPPSHKWANTGKQADQESWYIIAGTRLDHMVFVTEL